MPDLKIIADDKIPFLKGILEPYADVRYLPGAKITADDVRDADAIFTRTRTKCNEALLSGSSVKLIATATIGYDHIDTDYCDVKGIKWVNAPGCNSGSVKQYITTSLATLADHYGLRFEDMTLGIIGFGNVGSKVFDAAKALGMNVIVNDPPLEASLSESPLVGNPVNFSSLDHLLTNSDIVTCHVPLEKDGKYPTYHLANDDFFDKMKPDTVFINSSRGPVCDAEALKRAVGLSQNPKLKTFILDVWENEPTPDAYLLENAFIATPHIAGYSADGKANGTAACVSEFCNFFGISALHEWYPANIPSPPMPLTITIDGKSKSKEQIIFEAVTHTYPILDDSALLKRSPATFEEQRGSYHVRREFQNFTIFPENTSSEVIQSLESLGFRVDNA
ncbi:MAG: 4-phosphoerythronate dehydrogenase [Tannerella sp.]|jgi:erythronate-4-phosphate dehydrogenase|nr:4-phosphoerythronate dehydrogenase [Tannerella sp.]